MDTSRNTSHPTPEVNTQFYAYWVSDMLPCLFVNPYISVSQGGEGFSTPSQGIRSHIPGVLYCSLCGYHMSVPDCMMMFFWIMLHEITFQIVFSCDPIKYKMSLFYSVLETIKYHIDWTVYSLYDVVIKKYTTCCTVCDFWGGRMLVSHFWWYLCACMSYPSQKCTNRAANST